MTVVTTQLPRLLPLPRQQALDEGVLRAAPMGLFTRALFDRVRANQPIRLLLPTGTRVDTGEWFHRRSLWLATTETQLWLLAAGRKEVLQRLEMKAIARSTYNHITGRLIFCPAQGLVLSEVQLPPVEAHQVLSQIQQVSCEDGD